MINGHGYPTRHYHRPCHKASNLVHVCDVYDALRTKRPYRESWETERVLGYIEERAGTEFEPEIAGAFVRMIRKVEGGIQLSTLPTPNSPQPSVAAPGNGVTGSPPGDAAPAPSAETQPKLDKNP
jgi:HD-GYP domain-containing protein (c-di-GMP phosphodiesterase class II)